MSYRRQITRYLWNLWFGVIFFGTDSERREFFKGLQALAIAMLEKVEGREPRHEQPPWIRRSGRPRL